jgi:coenzyme PQQ precursor peptide PqqA
LLGNGTISWRYLTGGFVDSSGGILTKTGPEFWPFARFAPTVTGLATNDPRSKPMIEAIQFEAWITPDFVEYEVPMEVTAYAARME